MARGLNKIAANYAWGEKPKDPKAPSSVDAPATQEERKKVSEKYQVPKGGWQDRITKYLKGEK